MREKATSQELLLARIFLLVKRLLETRDDIPLEIQEHVSDSWNCGNSSLDDLQIYMLFDEAL